MRLYDTRTRQQVRVGAARTVRIYVCGITPYDSTHLGHAFTYTVFDVLVRALEADGHVVRYARNVTDVDDDILSKARELGVDYLELGRREMARFEHDLGSLNLRAPDSEPRATRTVPAIVTAVEGLVERGAAYVLNDGRVYFDTSAAPGHGTFARLPREEMLRQFTEKGGDPEAPGKRDALDFLLWQPSASGEPAWASPWGPGRPGWHIECSVMAMEELGAVIDVHGGGCDLIYPHHEAEILQAEQLTGQGPFARVWAHVGMVAMDGRKMSKSLGNLVFVADLLERFDGAAIRRYLLEHHYRQGWTFDDGALIDAAVAVDRWREVAKDDGRRPALEARLRSALAADLDTPTGLALIDEAAEEGAGASVRRMSELLGFELRG